MKNFLMILSVLVLALVGSGCGAYGSVMGIGYTTGGPGAPAPMGMAGAYGAAAASTQCGDLAQCATFVPAGIPASVTILQGGVPVRSFMVSPYTGPIAIRVSPWAQYTYTIQCTDLATGDVAPYIHRNTVTGRVRVDITPDQCMPN